jgi:CRP/FNR family transcriptional regulator, nitrogen oxide reductase regulator
MKTESGAVRAMTASEIAARVGQLTPMLLDGFAPSDIETIVGKATLRRFPVRSLLAREGGTADKFFLMLYGLARTFTTTRKGQKVVLLWIPPGDCSGGRALLSKPTPYLVTTETMMDSSALVWTHSAILSLSKQYPRLLENVLMIASDYVEDHRNLYVGASYDNAGQRVARILGNLAKGMGWKGFEGIAINVSNEELANEANVTVFTVSRLLSDWQRKGFLTKKRGRVVLHSPEELIRDAER